MKNQDKKGAGIGLFSEVSCLFTVEKEIVRFQFMQKNEPGTEIHLQIGYEYLMNSFFRQTVPTVAETDHAINYIEDELMSNKALRQHNETLFSSDSKIINLFRKNDLPELVFSRQQVEALFSIYARVVMGAPASEMNAELTRADFAVLLVVREIMHHLGFEKLRLIE